MRLIISLTCVPLCVLALVFPAQAKIEGFYKDVFQDEGTQISGGNLEIDCEYIGFTQEHLNTQSNETEQAKIMIKSSNDDNGYLLYPDGEPRFALIYYHGGYMGHASDLGSEGRQRIRDHYYHGGSQFGSCAGSYMLSSSSQNYFRLWPGRMNGPNVSNSRVDKIINAGSPFIGYNDFEEGDIISNVYHNNGGCVDTNDAPRGTQFCAMHNEGSMRGYAAIWTWKDNDTTGQVLGHTGHPEGNSAEAQIRYISASMLLIADGLGKPDLKSTLENGTTITMNKETADDDPSRTKIGDKQYHHFVLNCKDAKNVKVTVVGEDGYDFHLFVAKDTFAFNNTAEYADTADGHSKTLSIPRLETGTWYVGVKLYTTVKTRDGSIFPEYYDNLEVLNGIGYSVTADWEEVNIFAKNNAAFRKHFSMAMSNGKLHVRVGTLPVKSLKIFNARGRLCWEPDISRKSRQYTWRPTSTGMYIARLASGDNTVTRRITVVK